MLIKVDYPLKRLLTKDEAAEYCNIPLSRFTTACPKKPVRLYDGAGLSWDVRDLDEWIDAMKNHRVDKTADEMLDDL
jgi:hypothetical protein